jgi:glycosyltransferase involved in cell wall biosynthesis
MRILLVTNGLRFGGAERIVEALAIDLNRLGDDVEVVATTRDGPIGEIIRGHGIPVHVLNISSTMDLRVVYKLARIARRFNADVIHSHLAVSDIVSSMTGFLLRKPRLVSTVHNTGIELDRRKRGLWQASLYNFDEILAVSRRVQEALPKRLKSQVVHPSLIRFKDDLPSKEDVRTRLGIKPEERVIMAVGRLTPIKGFDVLRAAADLITEDNVRFLLIGEGGERARLEGGKLELLGARDDAAELMVAADMIVAPSRSEGLPQVLLEAMAAGQPVVATHVGGTPEVVVHEQTGLLLPPNQAQALADGLVRLLRDADERDRFGEAGRARLIREGFNRESMVDQTRRAYLGT